jgi:hypothetical protein
MKTTKSIRKPIRENRNIPDFMLRQIAEECAENVKRVMLHHIDNAILGTPQDRRYMLLQINNTVQELEIEVKEIIDAKISQFHNKSTR